MCVCASVGGGPSLFALSLFFGFVGRREGEGGRTDDTFHANLENAEKAGKKLFIGHCQLVC